TGSGIIASSDAGKTWDKTMALGLADSAIHYLAVSPTAADTVYAATPTGVFATADRGRTFHRVTFGLNFRGGDFLAFDPLDPSAIWLVTNQRICRSVSLPCADLSRGQKVVLLGSCEFTLDGKERHVFTIDEVDEAGGVVKVTVQSEPQKLELKVGESKTVDLNGDGVPDASLTVTEIAGGSPKISLESIGSSDLAGVKRPDQVASLEDLAPYFAAEPTWVEVQESAARWAEVHPDKIAAWRRGASLRAFMPEIGWGFTQAEGQLFRDRNQETWQREFSTHEEEMAGRDGKQLKADEVKSDYAPNTPSWGWGDSHASSSEGGSESASENAEADSDKYTNQARKTDDSGRTSSWDLKLDWDLSDFLYSKEQVNISREARDLVELRQDVLEQVTVQYFDRRSARIDMILNPPADPYSKVEMLLRIQQLDASLDALTGGFFTRTIQTRQKELPEFTAVTFIRSY
ncbi:MAG: hypothetical protein NTV79_12075, partial [Candidatus Aureabacteria bacterium]|nr:hypothetical protein [Candidatus Auribacterota bacterium]